MKTQKDSELVPNLKLKNWTNKSSWRRSKQTNYSKICKKVLDYEINPDFVNVVENPNSFLGKGVTILINSKTNHLAAFSFNPNYNGKRIIQEI